MSGSLNKVTLIGNLGRDPEIRRSQAGDPIGNFSIATSESWTDKDSGERKERTEWHNIVVFNEGLCRVVEQYLKKGSKVYVAGQMRTREYTDRDNIQRRATEVVLPKFGGELIMLGEPKGASESSYGTTRSRDPAPPPRPAPSSPAPVGGRPYADLDDDIPFAPEVR